MIKTQKTDKIDPMIYRFGSTVLCIMCNQNEEQNNRFDVPYSRILHDVNKIGRPITYDQGLCTCMQIANAAASS